MTDPAVGASTWASGVGKYTGTIGTLTGKGAGEAIHRKIWRRSLNSVVDKICKSVVPVWKRINGIASSIKTDPSKVYRKNWYAALPLVPRASDFVPFLSLSRTPYPYSDRRVRGSPRASGVGKEEAPVGSHSLLREPYVILPHHTAPSRHSQSFVALVILPLFMHVLPVFTFKFIASFSLYWNILFVENHILVGLSPLDGVFPSQCPGIHPMHSFRYSRHWTCGTPQRMSINRFAPQELLTYFLFIWSSGLPPCSPVLLSIPTQPAVSLFLYVITQDSVWVVFH